VVRQPRPRACRDALSGRHRRGVSHSDVGADLGGPVPVRQRLRQQRVLHARRRWCVSTTEANERQGRKRIPTWIIRNRRARPGRVQQKIAGIRSRVVPQDYCAPANSTGKPGSHQSRIP
jgi:hypothetical protein